jgi:hypothetical protein
VIFDRLFKSEHQRVEEMLSAYLDGELSPKEQARVEKHLAQCADCAQNLRTLRQTVALLRELPPVAVPRAFTIRPVQVAKRPSFFQTRRAYAYLRAATALATILFAVVLAGDVFLTGLAPYLAPARAPVVVEKEVVIEKEVPVTVEVEKEVVVEKKVVETVVVEKEAVVEKESVYAATPSPAPAEMKEEMLAPKPLPTPTVVAKEMEAVGTPPGVEKEATAEAPPSPGEERIEATVMPTPLPVDTVVVAEPAFTPTAMPTAVAEALPPTPIPKKPTARLSRFGLVLLRVVEVGLLVLVLVLAIATLVARRRQSAR